MKLGEITRFLEEIAPLNYQEEYDNSGLIVGNERDEINAALVALDCTEQIVDEAIESGCQLIITHHPIVFRGLKKFTGKTYVERVVMKALQHGIALYAIHTNLDNVQTGVNRKICTQLGLVQPRILLPKAGLLKKLVVFCPDSHAEAVRTALFAAGSGHIGQYSECSFNAKGVGTFKASEESKPFAGEIGKSHEEQETRIETVFKVQDQRKILLSLFESHPYEEVAYDIYPLDNTLDSVGSGMIGWLPEALEGKDFLAELKEKMGLEVIRHTEILNKPIKKVAVCGGSGSFLLKHALLAGADALVTADFKYHEFFDADKKLMICDIGHYESERFTSNLLIDNIQEKFPNFAIRLTAHNTNPINYFI